MAPSPEEVTSGGLLRLLADTLVLLFKTRHLSWHLNGDVGDGVRAIVRQDHRALDDAIDKIARRIIDLGRDLAPSYSELIRSSSVEQEVKPRLAMDVVRQIVTDHESILADIETLSVTMPLDNDSETTDLLEHLESFHRDCRDSLTALFQPPDQSVQ